MTKYKLYININSDIELDNPSPMYPAEFEDKINQLAGEKITVMAPAALSFIPGFVNSFCIKADKNDIFLKKVIPYIGVDKDKMAGWSIWDPEEKE